MDKLWLELTWEGLTALAETLFDTQMEPGDSA